MPVAQRSLVLVSATVSEQLPLGSEPRARRTDPETSHAAARSVDRRSLTDVHRMIGRLLALHGPLTDEQIADAYKRRADDDPRVKTVSPSGLRTRRAELVAAGLVEDAERVAYTAAGRRTTVWKLVGG